MIYIVGIFFIFIAELLIKNKVEKKLKENQYTDICNNKIFLTKYHNTGAFLNFLGHQRNIVCILSVIISIACTIWFLLTLSNGGKQALKVGLTLLLGGAYSNTYDRLKRKYVVDYFGFINKKSERCNVIYNLSDFAIMIGSLISTISSL